MNSPKASILCALLLVGYVTAALFAVDLGSEHIKVSLIKPGRVPISIVHNELSKRKTPAAVAFQTTTRLYGDNALGIITKKPERVFLRIRDFLGRQSTDPFLQNLYGGNPKWKPVYNFIQETNKSTIEFDIGDDQSLTIEEILASLFSYIKSITQEEAGETVVDCVIAVPAFFGPLQKRRLLDASKLADINVLAILNAHATAALQYGIDRHFNSTPETVLIYDMGANTIQVSLLKYSAYEGMQIGKKVMIGQFAVVDVTWNENLGGDHLDWALVHYFAARFNNKHNVDLYTSNRSIWKLKKAVAKTKHVLSANTDAHLNVEELYDGIDFSDKITRAEFEEMNSDFFTKAVQPLKTILERNNVNISSVKAVELIGGGTRVPKLQAVLSEALQTRPLDKHLDGDEAVAMGAGLVAANLSTIFRLRRFGYLDGVIYPMSLQVVEPEGWEPIGDVASLLKPKSLLPYLKRLPSKRVVNLFNVSGTDELQFQIRYNTTYQLPPGTDDDLYANYTVSGLTEAIKKWGEGGRIALHFVVDLSGLIHIDRAEYVIEVVQNEPPSPVPPAPAPGNETNGTESEISTAPAPEPSERNATTESAKKVVKKVPLKVSDANYTQPSMTTAQIKASKAILRKFAKGEAMKKKTEKAKNTLESYIVESQNKIREDYDVRQVTNETQRDEFLTQLTAGEDWLYMDGADSSADAFETKLKELQKFGEPIFARAAESVNRPLSVEKAKKSLEIILMAVNTWPDLRPWIAEDLIELGKEAEEFQKWLREQEEEQSQLEPHETPVFTSLDVLKRLVKIEKIMTRIGNKKPPKPKPPPTTNATNTTNDTTKAEKEEAKVEPEVTTNVTDPKEEKEQLTPEHIEL